ncbi:MAG: hypothetical protein IJG50_01605 [Clostridia bacterium]|nr:hypothetical protein [Clostridia bacterium]
MAVREKEVGLGSCVICGRAALRAREEGELTMIEGPNALRLKDGGSLCGLCVRRLRVMYPVQFKFDETKRLVVKKDPLPELSTEEAVRANSEAVSFREDMREHYGFHNAVFLVDAMAESKGGFLQPPIVTIFGQVLYGSFYMRDEVTILSVGNEIKATLEAIDAYEHRVPMDAASLKEWIRRTWDPGRAVAENGYPCKLVVLGKGISLKPGDLVVKD